MQEKTLTATPMAWVALVSLGLIWGASFLAARLALEDLGPLSVAAVRSILSMVVLLGIAFAFRDQFPRFSTTTDKRLWLHIVGMGLVSNAIPFTLLNWGQLHVTSAFAGISIAVVPLFVLPLAFFLVPGETFGWPKVLGFVLGFIGTVLLIGPVQLTTGTGQDLEALGRLACVAAAVCYAVGSLIIRLSPPVKALPFAACGMTVATLALIPVALIYEGFPNAEVWHSMSWQALGGLIYLGLLSTAVGTVLRVWIINSAGPTFMSQINYQVPVWALLFGVLVLGERLPSQFLIALALILLGLMVSRLRINGKLKA